MEAGGTIEKTLQGNMSDGWKTGRLAQQGIALLHAPQPANQVGLAHVSLNINEIKPVLLAVMVTVRVSVF